MAKNRKSKDQTVFEFLQAFEKENPGSPAIGQMYALYEKYPGITVDELKSAVASGVRVDDGGKVTKNEMSEVPEGLEDERRNLEARTLKNPIDRMFEDYDPKIRAKMLDPDSKYFYQKMPVEEFKRRAIDKGLIRRIDGGISKEEEERQVQEQRNQLGKLYNDLDRLAVSVKMRNISKEPLFEYDIFNELGLPFGYEDVFAKVIGNRLREKAAQGEGPTSWGEMDKGDIGAFQGDWLRNLMYGLAATGTLGGAGAVGAAGVGGLVDASARDNFTNEDMNLSDYLADIGLSMGGQLLSPSGPMVLKPWLMQLRNSGGGRMFSGFGSKLMNELRDVALHAAGEPVDIAKYGKSGAVLDKLLQNVMPELNAAGIKSGLNLKDEVFTDDTTDLDLVTSAYEKLKKRKPKAVFRAESFQPDDDLKPEERLTAPEFDLLNKYRELLFEAVK